jgi:hypothetical protein
MKKRPIGQIRIVDENINCDLLADSTMKYNKESVSNEEDIGFSRNGGSYNWEE